MALGIEIKINKIATQEVLDKKTNNKKAAKETHKIMEKTIFDSKDLEEIRRLMISKTDKRVNYRKTQHLKYKNEDIQE